MEWSEEGVAWHIEGVRGHGPRRVVVAHFQKKILFLFLF
jgi:hypothetical protein